MPPSTPLFQWRKLLIALLRIFPESNLLNQVISNVFLCEFAVLPDYILKNFTKSDSMEISVESLINFMITIKQ